MKKIGFIGMGNMASAIVKGCIASGAFTKDDMFACARDWNKLCRNADALGFTPVKTAEELIDNVDTVLIAIKPYQIESVIPPLAEKLRDKLVISVVGGWDHAKYESVLLPGTHYVYIMPNTPAAVCEGVFMVEKTNSLTDAELADVCDVFGKLGLVEILETHLMGPGMAIAGCGPAFAAMMIEALGDAGVKYGLQRKTAYALAAQTLAGTGKLQRATGDHPGVMKDAVCSPAGTTIRGVEQLEKSGFRAALLEAVNAVLNK